MVTEYKKFFERKRIFRFQISKNEIFENRRNLYEKLLKFEDEISRSVCDKILKFFLQLLVLWNFTSNPIFSFPDTIVFLVRIREMINFGETDLSNLPQDQFL